MKRVPIALLFCLPLTPALSQLGITTIGPNGGISWSNCFSSLGFSNLDQPIYRVDWASAPTGVWQNAALVTNAYSYSADELLDQSSPALFLRVVWLNATSAPPVGVYEITALDGFASVALTGRVELTSATGGYVEGTWQLQPPSATGYTNGVAWGSVSAAFVALDLSAGVEGPYYLDGTYSGRGFAGRWFRCGVVCVPSGNYTARRICP